MGPDNCMEHPPPHCSFTSILSVQLEYVQLWSEKEDLNPPLHRVLRQKWLQPKAADGNEHTFPGSSHVTQSLQLPAFDEAASGSEKEVVILG